MPEAGAVGEPEAVVLRDVIERCPEHEILVLFDIDGTIVDLRHTVVGVLRAYDDRPGTAPRGAPDVSSRPCPSAP